MRSVELFAGGGGLALGTRLAGFSSEVVAEWDRRACSTLRTNFSQGEYGGNSHEVIEGDIRDVDWSRLGSGIDLVSGGPPCQPFSAGGLGRAAEDERDMFPAAAEAIRVLQPRAFIIENVRGLTRAAFSEYFEYIKLRLAHPEIKSKSGELWNEHYARLSTEHKQAKSDTRYDVSSTLVNAADYGVPQQRWRVFIVGFRQDQHVNWSFPQPTHSAGALRIVQDQGSYWEKYQIERAERQPIRTSIKLEDYLLKPWRTVRDALDGLPAPGSTSMPNHIFQPGARIYPGHTGSYIDAPAKALKAGVHGVPGGENMIRYPDGSVRYFTIQEAARIQTFPDSFHFDGPWSEAMRQIGNAVPVLLAEKVAREVRYQLAVSTTVDRCREESRDSSVELAAS